MPRKSPSLAHTARTRHNPQATSHSVAANRTRKSARKPPYKTINLALQGGGAHGAFAWGVLDYLLEDGRLRFDGISGTSAGSMNAVVLAYGLHIGDAASARAALHDFWKAVSDASQKYSPVRAWPWDRQMAHWNNDNNLTFQMFKAMTNTFSPYQLNPMNFNPLRDLLLQQVDFSELNQCLKTKLFLSATNVRSGNVRIFNTREITIDTVMASACLPTIYQAVDIDGESYWDGGFMGNPALFPLFYETDTRDVLIVHINPIARDTTPTTPNEIDDRVNEISFNSSLIKELRAVAFVQKLLDEGWLKDQYRDQMKYVLIHSLRADETLKDLSSASKVCTEWGFLTTLRDRGRASAKQWLDRHYDDVGIRQTVDLRAEFLNSGSEMKARTSAPTRAPRKRPTSRVRRSA